MPLRFFYVGGPLAMAGYRVHAQADNLRVAFGKLRLQSGHVAQLSRAYRSEVLGVRKQDGPAIADPFVKVDGALRGFGGEIRSFRIDAQRHGDSSLVGFDGWGLACLNPIKMVDNRIF